MATATATAAPGMAASHPYTCNTCMVAFKDSTLQRGHMQSDWHRYNLKRRVASLPPLSSEIFTEKVLANQATAAATAAKASFERMCMACQKTYFSQNAYENHLNSQKHRARVAQAGSTAAPTEDETDSVMSSVFSLGETDTTVDARPVVDDPAAEAEFSSVITGLKKASLNADVPSPTKRPGPPTPRTQATKVEHPLSPSDGDEADSDEDFEEEDEEVILQKCLFCNASSESLLENVKHMQSKHGMFVPEKKYLVDPHGLITWLYGRVHALHECLYCGIIKHTTMGIQTHMRDKGHCMIAFDSEEQMVEVGQFYDFRSTYSDYDSDEESEDDDDDKEDDQKSQAKLCSKRTAKTIQEDGEGWETDEEDEDGDAGSKAPSASRKTSKKSAASQDAFFDEDGLHLPSGRTAGHRSLARYFRQNLHSYALPEERAEARRAALLTNGDDATMADGEEDAGNAERSLVHTRAKDRGSKAVTRANGGLGLLGAGEPAKREAKALEKADRRSQMRAQKQYQWGNDRRGNNQKHFRDPLLQ